MFYIGGGSFLACILLRLYEADRSAPLDLLAAVAWYLWLVRHDVADSISVVLSRHGGELLYTTLLAAGVALCSTLYTLLPHGRHSTTPVAHTEEIDHFLGSPTILPCRTTHKRTFPKKNSFSYSYLLVGIPVGWEGTVGSTFAVPPSTQPAKSDTTHRIRVGKNFTWFSVKAEDYLSRGNAAQGLKGKLHAFLHDQGISSNKYPYAYLVTAPRFCGYQFNPVSFWYLYDSNKRLQGMILEVNNTFDERRPYYLERNNETEVSDHGLANGHVHKEPAQKPISRDCKAAPEGPISFRATWAKDFHVSPFNSRKGSYDLLAFDPLRSSVAEDCQVNNTITLKSSKDHEKLEARVFSTEAAIDPSQSTSRDTARLIVAWWWVGFMTFPRIVKEAGKLFFREKLSVWYRPEVRERSIGRHEDATERILELYFRQYLRHQVETSATPLTVDYVMPSNVSAATETFRTVGTSDPPQHLTIKISSPIFYSRFVRYAHPMEAVSAEYLCAREDSKTLWTSDPTLLPVLFERRSSHKESTVAPSHGVADHWRWSIIRYLRRTPSPPQDNQNPSKAPTQSCEDIRLLPLAPIDEFVIGQCSYEESRDYRRNVMKLFLADYLAFGIPAMLHAYDLVLRCVLVYLGVAGVAGVRHWGLAGGLVRIAWGLGVCNGMHGWALLKSFA